MNLFKRQNRQKSENPPAAPAPATGFAELALQNIHDGVLLTDFAGTIQFINPAAVTMLGCGSPDNAYGLNCELLIKLQSKDGQPLSDTENPFINALRSHQPLENFAACLVTAAKRIPVALSIIPVNNAAKIITFRDIAKELREESEQAEFISTASHEMRTPVATIDGYLSLCLNPQTATIDERAKGYLTAAQAASQHLGRLFQDLLDVTKLDDGRLRPQFIPVELVGTVKKLAADYRSRAEAAGLKYQFGPTTPDLAPDHHLAQVVYGFIDLNFMREILDNLVDNAIKYTSKGGSIYINVRGDGDRALINVTDTGVGISSDDLQHIFQKFYRADNSDTREIGGTGLGLYLAKQRTEAMGGRIWAESAFGEGSTFYVSLPRISGEEYEKRMIAYNNAAAQARAPAPNPAPSPDATLINTQGGIPQ